MLSPRFVDVPQCPLTTGLLLTEGSGAVQRCLRGQKHRVQVLGEPQWDAGPASGTSLHPGARDSAACGVDPQPAVPERGPLRQSPSAADPPDRRLLADRRMALPGGPWRR